MEATLNATTSRGNFIVDIIKWIAVIPVAIITALITIFMELRNLGVDMSAPNISDVIKETKLEVQSEFQNTKEEKLQQ